MNELKKDAEIMSLGELEIMESMIKEQLDHQKKKLALIEVLRKVPSEFTDFIVYLFDGTEQVLGVSALESLEYEVFKPFIEQGLKEYRRRLTEIIQQSS